MTKLDPDTFAGKVCEVPREIYWAERECIPEWIDYGGEA